MIKKLENALEQFIKTSFFCWQDNYIEDVSTDNSSEPIFNWNFHGLYDIEKIKLKYFEKVSGSDFVKRFKNFIIKEIGFDSKLPLIVSELTALNDLTSDFYVIKDLPSDFHHRLTIFEFFISGFKIVHKSRKLTAVEFGLD